MLPAVYPSAQKSNERLKDLLPSNPPFMPRLLESSLPSRRAFTLEAISSFDPLLARICSIRAFASGVTATKTRSLFCKEHRVQDVIRDSPLTEIERKIGEHKG